MPAFNNNVPTRVIILVFLLAGGKIFAGNAFTLSPEIRKAWSDILHLNTFSARKLLNLDAKSNPGNPFQTFLLDQAVFAELVVSEDLQQYRQELAKRKVWLEILESADQASPYYGYCLADFHLRWALLRMKYGEEFQGALDLRKAIQFAESNLQKHPKFKLSLKIKGIVQTLAGAVPGKYQWLAERAGIRGNTLMGLSTLQELDNWILQNQTYRFLEPEVLFYRLFIHRNLPQDFPTTELQKRAMPRVGKEPLLRYVLASMALKEHQPERALQILNTEHGPGPEVKICHLEMMRAEAMLYLSLPGAEHSFKAFITCAKGGNYVKSAYRKWAWSELLKGNMQAYQSLMGKILEEGRLENEEDQQAYMEARKGMPAIALMVKARLSFDGGFYRESVSALLQISERKNLNHEQRAELHYRLARAYDKLEKLDLAIIFYRATLAESAKMPDYFYASSAYHLALVYNKEGNPEKAKECFKLALKSPSHPYKKSLDAKAKAGLALIDR